MKKIVSLVLLISLVFPGFTSGKGENIFRKNTIKKRMTAAALWQLNHPKHELNDWTNGAFYAGVMAAYQTTHSKKLYTAMMAMGEANGWKPAERLHHADDYAICQTYIDLYRIEKQQKMIQPTIDSVDKMIATPYQTRGIQKICWWWCDALFMAPPALVRLGMTTGNRGYLEFSDRLFRETVDLLWNPEESLFARDLNYVWGYEGKEMKEANGKKVFWSRGNGWVMGGLARILSELPKDYPMRGYYLDIYRKMAKKIASLQQADGLWRASLLDPGSYPGGEASGSGFYCYALAWGINNGILDRESYLPVVKRAWTGLNSLLTDEGYVGWVQPIGADPQKNFSPTSWEVYGTGAFLLAGSEVVLMTGMLSGFQKTEPLRFFKGNLHTHSYWSDGNTFPEEVARWYHANGYQFLAVTDHNILQEGRKTKVVGKDTVVLRELAGYRQEFEKPGEFLLLAGEEISDQSEKKPVHLNGINLRQVVKPTGGATVAECTAANVRAIRQALTETGNPEWIIVNHPNFGWALTSDALARSGARFFEVFNGHPAVRNYGDSAHIGTETMWDEANKWRMDHGEQLLLGIATDDAHQYDRYETGKANPGRGWVMVRGMELTPGALYQSMFAGDFYSSTGIELNNLQCGSKGIRIGIKKEDGVQYTTEFIGWLAGKDRPEILKTVIGRKAAYHFNGKELFVRARVTSTKAKQNPFAAGDPEMAWTQPVQRK